MRQLALDLQLPAPVGFDDFLIGPNLEAFTALKELALGWPVERHVYLWGEAGVGKTHLLQATVAQAEASGLSARYWDARHTLLNETAHGDALIAVDHVDMLDEDSQVVLFGLINAQRERGAALIAAGPLPPVRLALREDLRTRLGWGAVYRLLPPDDDDKVALLRHHAARRGIRIDEMLARWLVAHHPRDLASLTALVDQLDRAALAAKRPLTLPFAREVLRDAPRV
jgi:DnaA family protein